ncbi:RING-H2 finger protein [Quillaja saponaria]|uniref:RING-type E3 ubiquitin transferase n=1 Tax=Quillaja saponaria TaxID=32244 RepID=A0AAD7Q8L2_QUISA|nr:RING-H2 finger protein [Quillaja saponaria]
MDDMDSQNQLSGSFFAPLLISLAGVASFSIGILAYHFIVVRYCMQRQRRWRQQQESNQTATTTIPTSQLGLGVDEKVLNTLPILCYSKKKGEKLFPVDQSECVICLGELEEGETVRLLPNCRHAFHVPCIDGWFMAHSSCPVCRSPVVAPITSVIPIDVNSENDGVERVLDIPLSHPEGDVSTSTSHVNGESGSGSGGLLRHSVSLVFPLEEKKACLVTVLKRSLSMDQSYIAIDIQREEDQKAFSSSSSGAVLRQFDRMSTILMRSFLQFRNTSIGTSTNNGILPN